MNKDSKIYIAGHTGLVGSAIKRKLIGDGYWNFIERDIADLDLTDQSSTAAFFALERPEIVFDAAAKVGGIVANNRYRAQFLYENMMIQNNIIHQSYVYGVNKLIFLGSSCIYPRMADQPIKEEYFMTGGLEYTNEPYAIAKISGIKMCEAYHDQYGCNFLSVMPTNLYGPNDNYNLETSHVLPALIRKMHLGKCLMEGDETGLRHDLDKRPIECTRGNVSIQIIKDLLNKYGIQILDDRQVKIHLWGSGNPLREFLHVDDLADAVVYLAAFKNAKDLRLEEKINGRIQSVYSHLNIGCGEDISIRDLAYLVKEITGFKGTIGFDTSKPDGTPKKQLDITRLFKLGWTPTIKLHKGIKSVYEGYLNSTVGSDVPESQ